MANAYACVRPHMHMHMYTHTHRLMHRQLIQACRTNTHSSTLEHPHARMHAPALHARTPMHCHAALPLTPHTLQHFKNIQYIYHTHPCAHTAACCSIQTQTQTYACALFARVRARIRICIQQNIYCTHPCSTRRMHPRTPAHAYVYATDTCIRIRIHGRGRT